MDRQSAREYIKERLPQYVESITQKSKGANMYVCPLCGSGKGRSGTGAFSVKNGISWKCFSCNNGGDIFDLYGAVNRVEDHNQQLVELCDLYGVSIDGSSERKPEYQKQDKNEQYTHNSIHTSVYTPARQAESFNAFFLQAHENIEQTDYWKQRGLSRETVDRYKLGYIENWRHPNAPKAPATPRLIIPITEYSYLARDTRAEIPAEQEGYKKSKAKGAEKVSWTFNSNALKTATKPVFVVEGELDALSIIEVGGEAVALGSINYVRAFLEILNDIKPARPLVIALDNETEPEKREKIARSQRELTEGLERLQIPYIVYNPAGQYKDANEALQRDREALRSAVAEAEHIETAEEQARRENYLKTSTANYLQSFVNGIAESVDTPYIPTGFEKLDSVLDGGLYEGLYIVGAISSLGKTTLICQIADQIARAENDVLIFSLEMARTEIMAKSISRHTLQIVMETGGDIRNAKTARGITTGKRYENYSNSELDLINKSIIEYRKYAPNIYISEGVGDIGVKQIRETVKQHIHYTGKTPVVVVDYMQILAPYSERMNEKQNTDMAVLELKRISRDYKTPVIAISSFNRSNYKEAVSMCAFKESGAIEYGCDVLIGLQLKGAGSSGFDENEEKRKNPREIELIILKNRNGRTGDSLGFNFYPLFNYFCET